MTWQRAISVFALGLLLAGAAAETAAAREARCLIRGNGMPEFRGRCEFVAEGSSFALTAASNGPAFPAGIEVVSVEVIGRGQAEVRGLTDAGINSRWGAAQRSKRDGACWQGADFLICAW